MGAHILYGHTGCTPSRLTMRKPPPKTRSTCGFSLLEAVIAMGITLIICVGVIASVIFSRQTMELDKQRIAAHNYCRQFLETAETGLSTTAGITTLVPFNAPGAEDLKSNVAVEFYPITTDNRIGYSSPIPANAPPPQGTLVVCRVVVTWYPPGSWSRQQRVQMSTLVRAGTI